MIILPDLLGSTYSLNFVFRIWYEGHRLYLIMFLRVIDIVCSNSWCFYVFFLINFSCNFCLMWLNQHALYFYFFEFEMKLYISVDLNIVLFESIIDHRNLREFVFIIDLACSDLRWFNVFVLLVLTNIFAWFAWINYSVYFANWIWDEAVESRWIGLFSVWSFIPI